MKIRTFYILWLFTVIFISACFLWIIKINSFETYATEIWYHDRDIEKKLNYSLEEYLKSKSIISFKLIGNEKYDNKVIDRFQLEIQKVKQEQDLDQVVHLKFSTKTKYKELIRAFQICKIEDCSIYIPNDYDLWVIPVAKKIIKKNSIPK